MMQTYDVNMGQHLKRKIDNVFLYQMRLLSTVTIMMYMLPVKITIDLLRVIVVVNNKRILINT